MRRPAIALLLGLALLTAITHREFSTDFRPHREMRQELHRLILSNEAQPPYRYRVLYPYATAGLGWALRHTPLSLFYAPANLLDTAQFCVVIVALAAAYIAFSTFLLEWFSETEALLGTVILAALIPSTVTGYYMDGDFVTLALYALGLLGFVRGRIRWVSLIFLVGGLHRMQLVFLAVLYVAFEAARGRLLERKVVQNTGAYLVIFGIVHYLVRDVRGDAPTDYTAFRHIYGNLHMLPKIWGLWGSIVAPIAVLALVGFGRKPRFLQYAAVALVPYLAVFPFKGNMWELAKALPIFLILIPMALFTLSPSASSREAE